MYIYKEESETTDLDCSHMLDTERENNCPLLSSTIWWFKL